MPAQAPIEHTFVFNDTYAARRFVERLVLNLKHLAIYIDGTMVKVWGEGALRDAHEIIRLSRESGARVISKD